MAVERISTLKIEAACSSRTFLSTYHIKRCQYRGAKSQFIEDFANVELRTKLIDAFQCKRKYSYQRLDCCGLQGVQVVCWICRAPFPISK
jgi:hypothetical protein